MAGWIRKKRDEGWKGEAGGNNAWKEGKKSKLRLISDSLGEQRGEGVRSNPFHSSTTFAYDTQADVINLSFTVHAVLSWRRRCLNDDASSSWWFNETLERMTRDAFSLVRWNHAEGGIFDGRKTRNYKILIILESSFCLLKKGTVLFLIFQRVVLFREKGHARQTVNKTSWKRKSH